MFLLRSLHALAERGELSLEVAHFNHRWRGAESDADAAFVEALARELELRFHLDSASGEPPEKKSPEEAARDDRHQFFNRVARTAKATAVATGHTRDDQFETYLLGWLRGSGPSGASLTPPAGLLPGSRTTSVRLVRPLLCLDRSEIREALMDSGSEWREDRSNADPRYLRNRVRGELVPLLEALAPSARKTILRSAALARDAATYLEDRAKVAAGRVFTADGSSLVASRAAFLELEPVLRAAVLQRAVGRLVGSATDVESAHLEGALALIGRGAGGRRTPLGPGAELRLARGQLQLSLRQPIATKGR